MPLVLAAIIAIGAYAAFPQRQAEADSGAILYQPQATCASPTEVAFNWLPVPGATAQHLDLSVHDNDFADGTYTTVQLQPHQTSITLQPIRDDLPNFWRVVGTAPDGDVEASEAGAFMPCNTPILLTGPATCINYTNEKVDFRWAPLAQTGGQQYLEIDPTGDFAGDDLTRVGPFDSSRSSYEQADFKNDTTYYFRVVLEQDGAKPLVSQVGAFTPACMPVINTELVGTDDRLISPQMGINAPVNMRDVGFDNVLGVPSGAYDVVRYNFAAYPQLSGAPGQDGTMLIGGHVDYYVVGLAVFAPLRKAQVGDTVEYWQGDTKFTYVVDWVTDIPYTEGLSQYLTHGTKALLLITCNGIFNKAEYGGYNQRRLVHAVLQESPPS